MTTAVLGEPFRCEELVATGAHHVHGEIVSFPVCALAGVQGDEPTVADLAQTSSAESTHAWEYVARLRHTGGAD